MKEEIRDALYQSLAVLLEETDKEKFSSFLLSFTENWAEKEEEFIKI